MRRGILICIPFLLLFGSGLAESASFTIRKVVAAGEDAPQGGTFTQFDPAAVHGHGAILFDALIKKKEGQFHGVYLARGSSLSRVVATGDSSPLGGTFIELSFMALNGRGHVAFLGSATGGVARAIYYTEGAGLKKVVAVGEPSPGGGVLREFADVAFNDAGAVAFLGRVGQSKVPRALFLASAGGLVKVLGVGEPTPVGGRFAAFINLSLNNRGEMAFEGKIHGGRSPSGIFVGSQSGVRKVVAVGDPSPVGGTFRDLALPVVNEHGDVVFWASLEGAKVPAGLFLASAGGIEKLVARGDPAPGGGRFSFIGLSYSFNRSGMVAFQAGITEGEASAGIFLAEKGRVTSVVRVGDPTPLGGRFTDLTGPEVGHNGTVAFAAGIDRGQSSSGLFLAVPTGR
ncbi:MAG: choice-of-anchor tandem repeat NxxGxxAF-containing protein [Candidatus Methylomirabilales bacterium]